jgi:predicted enzyme related to lactoylglutathione lyase
MPNNIAHFAVHADDVERARAFYRNVFDWHFEPWGPPGFYQIVTGSDQQPGIAGALHQRTEAKSEFGMRGFLCTIAVEDVDAIRALLIEHGATITQEKYRIPGVGTLIEFRDPEGNIVQAMQYGV